MATCQIHKIHPGIECPLPPLASDPEGLCILHSRQPDKDQAAFDAALQEKLAQEDYDFRRVFFPGRVYFRKQEFKKRADFRHAEFASEANFSYAKFIGEADFSLSKFFGNINFFNADFAGKVDFSAVKFADAADFRRSKFANNAKSDFSWVEFGGEAKFSEAEFFGEANFRNTKFFGVVNFNEAKFFKFAYFINSKFAGEAESHFSKTEFAGESYFWNTEFNGDVNFEKANFCGLSKFVLTIFCCKVKFRGATFSGNVIFRLIKDNPREIENYHFTADFENVNIEKPGSLCFDNVSLAHVNFFGTDLRLARFRNVSWNYYKGRQIIYDEIFLKNIWESTPKMEAARIKCCRVYAGVEELYRYLKLNYESDGDYKQVGDFHYGEMEMHRCANPWQRWFPLSLYNLYRVLSGYGERPLRAIIWIPVFFLGLAALVYGLGLKINEAGTLAGFVDSLLFTLRQATFQRPFPWEVSTLGGQLGSILSRIVLPGQAALFILALRNRLGRRR